MEVELHVVPLTIGGKLVGLYALYQDITFRKQSETKLQEANQQLANWVTALEKRSNEIRYFCEPVISSAQACATNHRSQ